MKPNCSECARYNAEARAAKMEELRVHAEETGCPAYSHVRAAVAAKVSCAAFMEARNL